MSLTSIPHDRYDSVSYRSRKPDLVAYRVSMTGPYAITLIGDVKPFDGMDRPFSDMQVGHVIDMGWELLRWVQPWRSTVLVFLTDTRRWQFFEMKRTNMDLHVDQSAVIKDWDGWRIYFALLCAPMEILGFESISIQGVEFSDLLGIGKKYVFSGRVLGSDGGLSSSSQVAAAGKGGAARDDGMQVFKVFPKSDCDVW